MYPKKNNASKTFLIFFHLQRFLKVQGSFDWSQTDQSLVLGSFFYGYVVSQLLGGFVIGKFGAKWVFGVGTLVDAVLALLSPVVAKSLGTSGYVFLRIIQGLSEVTKINRILCLSLVI